MGRRLPRHPVILSRANGEGSPDGATTHVGPTPEQDRTRSYNHASHVTPDRNGFCIAFSAKHVLAHDTLRFYCVYILSTAAAPCRSRRQALSSLIGPSPCSWGFSSSFNPPTRRTFA